MDIQYKLALTNLDKLSFASIALSHNLFISGWDLYRKLSSIERIADSSSIAIAFFDDIPIGVSFKYNNTIQCFVDIRYRRKGIGSELVSIIKDSNSFAKLGFDFSLDFWIKNKVSCLHF